jgi:transcriptional regulator with XRE-family HTH domain
VAPVHEVTSLLDDFVFRDRRIADVPSIRVNVYLAERDTLRLAARSRTAPEVLPKKFYGIGAGFTGAAFHGAFSAASDILLPEDPPADNDLPCIELMRIPNVRRPENGNMGSILACPIESGAGPIGVVSLESRDSVQFDTTDIRRVQILGALVAYDIRHLQQSATVRSQLSDDLGRVLRSAREELGMTQDDLAELVGTSRIALSRWEAGAQPPSRGPLRRWATALRILAGGRAEIVAVVDATPQLLEVLRRDPRRLSDLSPEQFELLVAERLDRMGYAVQRTGATTLKDGGIDIIAVPKFADVTSFLLAVQVKHHRGARATGRPAVDRLLAWQNTAFRLGMLVTNTRFTRDALWTAARDPARHFLRLRDFADVTRWLQGVFSSELDWREIPDSIQLAPGVSVQVPKPRFTEAGVVWPLKDAFEEEA